MPFKSRLQPTQPVSYSPNRGILLQAHAGLGKTYMVLPAIKYLLDTQRIKLQSDWPMPILWVTPAAVIAQTLEVINQFGLTHKIFPMSYAGFRGKLGSNIYWESAKNPYNNAKVYAWKPSRVPSLVVFDECQGLKNESLFPDSALVVYPAGSQAYLSYRLRPTKGYPRHEA